MELLACWQDDHSLLWCWSVGGGSVITALIFDPFFLFSFFRSSGRRAALVEAGLINSEINKQGCGYVSLQMWRRCIDRCWGGSIPPSTLPLPERGVRVVPPLPLISTV